MSHINRLVDHILEIGYLSHEMEETIRSLFSHNRDVQDIDALIHLQRALDQGTVRRQVLASSESPVNS